MKTISGHVQQYMKQRPFLTKYLTTGVINYRALARRIQPIIADQIGEAVSAESIAVSLQRLSKQAQAVQPIGVLAGVQLISHLHVVNFSDQRAAEEVIEVAASLPGEFCNLVRGSQELTVVVADTLYQQLPAELLQSQTSHLKNVIALVIRQLDQTEPKVGRLAYPLSVLAENAIPVVMSLSTCNEQLILVEDGHVDQAVKLLRKSLAK